jgi:hypothetical protein
VSVFTVKVAEHVEREDYQGAVPLPDPWIAVAVHGFAGSRLDVTSPRLVPSTPVDWKTKQPIAPARLDLDISLTVTDPKNLRRSIGIGLYGQDPEDLIINLIDLAGQFTELATVAQDWLNGQMAIAASVDGESE